MMMKIGIAQINTKVGDLDYNEKKIINAVKMLGKDSDIIVFPELSTTGYPPQDLLFDENFVRDQKDIVYRVFDLAQSIKKDLKVILGFVDYDEVRLDPMGKSIKYNCAAVIGRDINIYKKQLLPTYDVFAEKRYFSSGTEQLYFKAANEVSSVLVCEDMWDQYYDKKPVDEIKKVGVQNIFNISASPYYIGKQKVRFDLVRQKAKLIDGNFIYVNQVGAQDELIFDGASLVVDNEGFIVHHAKSFEEELSIADTSDKMHALETSQFFEEQNDLQGQLLLALKLGLKDYLLKSGIKKVVLGLSGGIDSAVCAYIISKVLDKKDYEFITMPSKHTKSLDDTKALAGNLGADLNVVDISRFVDVFGNASTQNFSQDFQGIAYENTQARIRGNILMMRANQIGAMVINTSNKTEASLGYGTIYGDMIGGLGLIGDLNKKEIYAFARYINQIEGKTVIPQNIIDKPASAELQDQQIDPFDYERVSEPVDELLFSADEMYISQKYGLPLDEVKRYKKLIRINEFKRRQSPPILKVKANSIGSGRRYPVA